MNKSLFLSILLAFSCLILHGKTIYVAPQGRDSNAGTINSPLATLAAAQNAISPGDTVYFRGGTYRIGPNQIASYEERGLYACVFHLTKGGTAQHRTVFAGYPGERPVFDLSEVKPVGKRVAVFYIHADYLHLKNFDIIGTQVTITTHTQSECVTIRRGNSYNIIEDVAVHDGMGIGFCIWRGSHNLFLNCDAYNNYDSVSEQGAGGNTDGFGCHAKARDEGNVFRGCRAWNNSDDGFDLIRNLASVTIDHCWSFYNGYKPYSTTEKAGDGNGFKAGGYGLKVQADSVKAPRNVIKNCIAYHNRANGFYSNHHLGGNDWIHNTSYDNQGYNYDMRNQQSWDVDRDVPGYGHVLKNNLSVGTSHAYRMLKPTLCICFNNSFLPVSTATSLTDQDFEDLTSPEQLSAKRQPDGSLPELTFLKLRPSSKACQKHQGYPFEKDWIE